MGVIFIKNFDLSPNWGCKHWPVYDKWVAAKWPKVDRFEKLFLPDFNKLPYSLRSQGDKEKPGFLVQQPDVQSFSITIL